MSSNDKKPIHYNNIAMGCAVGAYVGDDIEISGEGFIFLNCGQPIQVGRRAKVKLRNSTVLNSPPPSRGWRWPWS